MSEHPFAHYVRILGKGPRLSRSLTFEETRAAVGMILRGEVEPVQLGAFLCLMRVRTESPEEVAGFATAVRDSLQVPVMPPVDIDWPTYAGKSRRPPLFILAALLLTHSGLRIAMHGTEGHTAGRLYASEALTALGMPPARSMREAAAHLAARNLAYVPMEAINHRLTEIMELKSLLGLRSPLHTVARNLNPLNARTSLMSVFHPNYRGVHRDAAALMGMSDMVCFKGEGGEIERRPEKPCEIEGLRGGVPFNEEWAPLTSAMPGSDIPISPVTLLRLWRGELEDVHAAATVIATAAVALRMVGRAPTPAAAEALARQLWTERRRDVLAA